MSSPCFVKISKVLLRYQSYNEVTFGPWPNAMAEVGEEHAWLLKWFATQNTNMLSIDGRPSLPPLCRVVRSLGIMLSLAFLVDQRLVASL